MAKHIWKFVKSKKIFIVLLILYTVVFILAVRFIFHILPICLAGCLGGSQHRYAACWKNGCISPISAPHFALLSPFIVFHSSFLHCFSRGSSGKAPRFLLPGDTFATKHSPPPCGRFWSAHGRNCRSGFPLRRRIFRVTWVPPCPRCKAP